MELLTWAVENTVIAAGSAAVVMLLSRGLSKRPALGHLLWLLTLVVLIAPPLTLPWTPGGVARNQLRQLWVDVPSARVAVSPAPAPNRVTGFSVITRPHQ